MKKKLLLVVLCVICSVNFFYGQIFNEQSYKFSKVLDWISTYYVDTVNEEELVEGAIVNMLHELDPHSAYISKEDVEAMNEHLQGNFEGIGVTFNVLHDTIYIISPISGGPSEKVGIQAGDKIVKIEQENVAGIGIKNSDVIKKLRGKKGTKVNVSIKRKKVDKLIDFTITRDKIPIYSIDAAYLVNDSTGYIKINTFALTTMDEFEEAAEMLQKQNATNLIIDLSGNTGGYLDIAYKLADQFFPENHLIVYTEGENNPKRTYMTTENGLFLKGKIVVIIDQGSASASEILSGAIQDWDRGIIVGRRSFGKGLVQRPLSLPDGSMIRLTVARYYTPTGRLIQKPYEDGYEEYTEEVINRYNSGELLNEDSIHFPDHQKFETLKNKRLVYGGGGIMPDFFIPIDTSENSDYYRELISSGVLNRFILKYVDDHRNELKKSYPDFEMYEKQFVVSDDVISDLISYAEDNDIEKNEQQYEISKAQIILVIKAYIARDIWSISEFYKIINLDNPAYLKAIQVINNSKLYDSRLKGEKISPEDLSKD